MNLPAASRAAAFSLVEVALALGIAGFCLVTVIGLVPLGVSTEQIASEQAAASSILTHVLADLRATPATLPPGAAATTAVYAVPIPAATAAAPAPFVRYFGNTLQQFSVAPLSGSSRFRLTVKFLPPPGGRAATLATLLVSWPAQVDPATGTPAGHVQFSAALDRN